MKRVAAVGLFAILVGSWGYVQLASQSQGQSQEPWAQAKPSDYKKPRYPARPKQASSVEELMPYARAAARNKSNILGLGFGVVNPGETVMLVGTVLSEANAIEAVKRALEERKVKVLVSYDYDWVGVTRDDALALAKALEPDTTTEQGYLEGANWARNAFPNQAGQLWLKQQRPDLYNVLWPAKTNEFPAAIMNTWRKMRGEAGGGRGAGPVRLALVAHLQKHPEIRGAFEGKGGPIWMSYHPIEDRWLGTFTQDDRVGLISEVMSYPADVWMLTEELSMEPLSYIDKVHAYDPEGTDVSWDLTAEQAQKLSKGVYLRGHLFLFPQEAYGQYALSVVNYPALQKEWISPEPQVQLNGVIAGTNGHGGFFPRIEEHFRNGYLAEVKGGGYYGETLRTFLKYPKINELVYPYFNKEHPGYFYHFETALGTNPKVVRAPLNQFGGTSPERMHAGVYHWALGQNVWNDRDSFGGSSTVTYDWGAKNKMPVSHGFHIHTYFTTFRVHLRDTQKWVNLTDKGRLVALDNPEVRALASRYGSPEEVLREAWVPELPGINVEGQYEDYARDPYKYAKAIQDQAYAGTYKYLAPFAGAAGGSKTQH